MSRPSPHAIVLGAIGALGTALFLALAAANVTEWGKASARDEDYNLLVQGFQHGQLSLAKAVPAGLSQLADPYDPAANAVYRAIPYGLDDLSYRGGKLYLYFGPSPALLLFWPWAALTGDYLFQRTAVAVFCSAGFLASLGLLHGLWRRYFSHVGLRMVAALALALALATSAPILLQKADVWEVPIACGYALTMLALGAVWQAWHREAKRGAWLLAASLAMGLALAARPSLLFGAAILLVPVFGRGENRPGHRIRLLLCAAGPLVLCGLGFMLYNQLRFGAPLNFGEGYQLGLYRQDNARHFSASYLGFNFWIYFLQPLPLGGHFPFVGEMVKLPPPEGHAAIEDPFGVLAVIPFLAWALAAPLAWRQRAGGPRAALRRFTLAAALLFGTSALLLCLFYGNCSRYEMDFLPALALLAVLGVLGSEHALAGRSGPLALSRAAWGLALLASAALVAALSCEHYADQRYRLGNVLMAAGRAPEAITQYKRALAANPMLAGAAGNLGAAFLRAGRVPEAIASDERALRLAPHSARAHYNLAGALLMAGHAAEGAAEYEQAYQLEPDLRPATRPAPSPSP
jgi:tetratricopeptide (TPR) repeat protein